MECKKLVCVTGASGFVASWLVKRLLERGYHVRGTVRNPGDKSKTGHLWALPGAKERLELVAADLLTQGSFDAAVSGCEGVFHTAAPVKPVHTDPQEELIDPCVKGTWNVLQACKNANSVKRVILTSSSSTVRVREDIKPNESLDESSWSSSELFYRIKMWYGLAKLLAEQTAWDFAVQNDLDLVVVVPSYIIGPILPPEPSATCVDVLSFLEGERMKISIKGWMGFVHLDDVATSHIVAYEEPTAKGRFLCSAAVVHVDDLANLLANRDPQLSISLSSTKSHDRGPCYSFDCSKINRLGVHFKSLEDMFDDFISSARSRGLLDPVRRNTSS